MSFETSLLTSYQASNHIWAIILFFTKHLGVPNDSGMLRHAHLTQTEPSMISCGDRLT